MTVSSSNFPKKLNVGSDLSSRKKTNKHSKFKQYRVSKAKVTFTIKEMIAGFKTKVGYKKKSKRVVNFPKQVVKLKTPDVKASKISVTDKSKDIVEQSKAWNEIIHKIKQGGSDIVVNKLFTQSYPDTAEKAEQIIDDLLADKDSNLSRFCNKLFDTWQGTAQPKNMNQLKSNLKEKLLFSWKRASQGDVYKLQMVVESLCLQPGGGHHQSPELKALLPNCREVADKFRDGLIYDGENAGSSGQITQSQKKIVAVESAYKGSEPGVVRNESNIPDISLSNLGDNSGVVLEGDLVVKSIDGKVLKDSVAFSNGVYSFHGASVEMETRDAKIAKQLETGEFERRIDSYVNHHLSKGRLLEDLRITGDANLCLFDDDEKTGERTLKLGVQEILNKYNLALVVPSGKVTWGRPISDQLHKNATSKDLEGHRDTMLLLVPVGDNNVDKIKALGGDLALKQDTFFPDKTIDGSAIDIKKMTHPIKEDRKQFSQVPNDRVMMDHGILTGPDIIVGNTADCFGVGTPGKSLTFSEAKNVWGENVPSSQQYQKMMGDSAEVLSDFLNRLCLNHNP